MPTDLLLIEAKTTENLTIPIEKAHLIKITQEAYLQMKSPAMVYSFPVMPTVPVEVDKDWLLIPLGVWTKLHGPVR